MMIKRGFTLIEMLVVIGIIVALAGIAYPVANSFIGRSREASCLNNLRSLGVALEGYLQENNNIMPTLELGRASKTEDVPVLETVLLPYTQAPEAFRCPADKQQFEKSGSSYLWVFLVSGEPATKLTFFNNDSRPDKIPLITDKESWHPNGTNFLYADYSATSKTRFGVGN
jgi:prepilin-type N-terminal cleavage/methylation domain-containing protein/prepilin-type processing-associated H-X9-DG protein